jgi:hypothetical protein
VQRGSDVGEVDFFVDKWGCYMEPSYYHELFEAEGVMKSV